MHDALAKNLLVKASIDGDIGGVRSAIASNSGIPFLLAIDKAAEYCRTDCLFYLLDYAVKPGEKDSGSVVESALSTSILNGHERQSLLLVDKYGIDLDAFWSYFTSNYPYNIYDTRHLDRRDTITLYRFTSIMSAIEREMKQNDKV